MTEPLLKSADVARLLQVHPKHVYRLLARGLPAHRVGSEWRFSREEVLAWSGSATEERAPPPRSVPAPPISTPAAIGAPPLLGANGDLVIEKLFSALLAIDKPLGFVLLDRGRALDLLARRGILLAGFHGDVPPSHVDAARLARVHLVVREVGLAHGPSFRVKKLKDVSGKRLALRPPSAGVRAHFDRALAEERTSLAALRAEVLLHDSHRDACCAVLRGEADVALTTSAWAEKVGLRFFSLASEPYDLLLYAENLGTPACVAVCEVAQGAPFRKALGQIAGYDPRRAGEIRYER